MTGNFGEISDGLRSRYLIKYLKVSDWLNLVNPEGELMRLDLVVLVTDGNLVEISERDLHGKLLGHHHGNDAPAGSRDLLLS